MGALLTARDLRKRYGAVVALDGVSLDIEQGGIVGLLGPNGAGKTTLMKVLVGLVKADDGIIELRPSVGGRDVAIGALIERPGFYPYLTARRNLEALALTAGISPRGQHALIQGALERVDLKEAADRKVGGFSTGMRQRLGIAAALLSRPDLLILDEPVSGLDPAGVAAIRELLIGLRREGSTVLVSSHLLGEVEQVCDRIVIIDRGRVRANGSLGEITTGPARWRLTFGATEQAERAASLLQGHFAASVVGLEVHAVSSHGSTIGPLEVVSPAGLIPREVVHLQPSLEDAYLRLTRLADESVSS